VGAVVVRAGASAVGAASSTNRIPAASSRTWQFERASLAVVPAITELAGLTRHLVLAVSTRIASHEGRIGAMGVPVIRKRYRVVSAESHPWRRPKSVAPAP